MSLMYNNYCKYIYFEFPKDPLDDSYPYNSNNISRIELSKEEILGDRKRVRVKSFGRLYEVPRKSELGSSICDRLANFSKVENFSSLYIADIANKALNKDLVLVHMQGSRGNIAAGLQKRLKPHLEVSLPIDWTKITERLIRRFEEKFKFRKHPPNYLSDILNFNGKEIKQQFLGIIYGRPTYCCSLEETEYWKKNIKDNLKLRRVITDKTTCQKISVLRPEIYEELNFLEQCIEEDPLAQLFSDFCKSLKKKPFLIFAGKKLPNNLLPGTRSHYILMHLESILLEHIMLDLYKYVSNGLLIVNLESNGLSILVPRENFDLELINFSLYNKVCSELLGFVIPITFEHWAFNKFDFEFESNSKNYSSSEDYSEDYSEFYENYENSPEGFLDGYSKSNLKDMLHYPEDYRYCLTCSYKDYGRHLKDYLQDYPEEQEKMP